MRSGSGQQDQTAFWALEHEEESKRIYPIQNIIADSKHKRRDHIAICKSIKSTHCTLKFTHYMSIISIQNENKKYLNPDAKKAKKKINKYELTRY